MSFLRIPSEKSGKQKKPAEPALSEGAGGLSASLSIANTGPEISQLQPGTLLHPSTGYKNQGLSWSVHMAQSLALH